ncbi:MAG: T9SS type A sorting domain-containing protein, partial [Ignavibacteriales bacterium]|nr:T9SS type A sorting domain-containing protein [Ignavibacteriales bacterium]
YNVLGQEIATLVNEEKLAGTHIVEFNASNLSSGIYFYRIETGKFVETKKMLLLK